MAYDANKPANDDFIADAPQELRTNFDGLKNDQLVNAGLLNGLKSGNAQGNIPVSNGTVNTGLNADKLDGNDASAFANATHGHTVATGSSDGFMANTDKQKLDTIATGAEVNQVAFSNVLVGATTLQADSKTDTLEIVAGTNISVVADATNDRLTFSVTGKVDSAASSDYATTAGSAPANGGTATTISGSITGNQVSADRGNTNTDLSTSRELRWRNYGNGHTIIDNSKSEYPGGNTNAQNAWCASFPVLMGYNGIGTYGVRVDSARVADTAGSAPANGGNSVTVGGLVPTSASDASTLASRDSSGDTAFHAVWTNIIRNINGIQVADLSGGKTLATTDQIPATFDAGHSFATNGWQKLSNGLILQWGDSADAATTPFPIAFPNGCLNVAIAPNGSSGNAVAWWQMKVTVTNTSIINTYSDALHYIAIGY